LAEFADEPFAQAEAARLDELRLSALEDRIDAELAQGRHRELIGDLEAAARGNPSRERLWARWMLALYRCGRQAEALSTYQELRAHLGEELGITPSPDLVALEEAILLQKPELDWVPTPPQPLATEAPTRNGARRRDQFGASPTLVMPTTRYAQASDGVHIAYQVVGDGPFDLVVVGGLVSHLELAWEGVEYAHYLRRLASFARLICFDKRGTGMSDPVSVHALPTLEQRMDDFRAVLDAVVPNKPRSMASRKEVRWRPCPLPPTPSEPGPSSRTGATPGSGALPITRRAYPTITTRPWRPTWRPPGGR
jgi:tetratricopeptide (TPR) repeat protein